MSTIIDGASGVISNSVTLSSSTGIGYATGSGGAVTQATNKSTTVTLNTPSGQITLNNAALAGATTVVFNLNSTFIAATDTVIVNVSNSVSGAQNYLCGIGGVGTGNASILLRNNTAGSLSDAVVLNFAIIKGAAS